MFACLITPVSYVTSTIVHNKLSVHARTHQSKSKQHVLKAALRKLFLNVVKRLSKTPSTIIVIYAIIFKRVGMYGFAPPEFNKV